MLISLSDEKKKKAKLACEASASSKTPNPPDEVEAATTMERGVQPNDSALNNLNHHAPIAHVECQVRIPDP